MRWALPAAILGGFGAVAAEVVFFRRLALVFGVTATAAAVTAAVYLAGMAVGAALGGRLADRAGPRARWLYAGAEAFGAAWVLATPALFAAADPVVTALGADATLPGALLATTLLVGPAAVASGATFPALVRAVGDPAGIGRLYGVNALGAAAGALAAGLWLTGHLGVTATGAVAAAASLGAGLCAVGLPRAAAAPPEPTVDLPPGRAIAALATLGAMAMAGELGWARLLEQTGPNAHALAFPLVLSAWLAGLALGSVRAVGAHPEAALARALAVGGGATALGLYALLALPPEPLFGHHVGAAPGNGAVWALTGIYVSADRLAVYLLAAAGAGFASGSGFPIAAAALARARHALGGGVGLAGATGIAAGAMASMWLGLLPVPALGVVDTLAIAAVAALGLAAVVARSVAYAAAAALAVPALLLPPWAGLQIPAGEAVEAFVESPSGPSAITDGPEGRFVYTHGERVSGLQLALTVPLALHPAPARVLLVAFGTGVNIPTFLRDPAVKELTVVDIDPALPRLAEHHPLVGPGLFDGARSRYVVADARHHLRRERGDYDVIYSDVATYAQYADLGTVEFFARVRERLAPGGVFVVKLHLDTLTPAGVRRFVDTVVEVFPDAWVLEEHGPVVALVAFADREGPLALDARWREAAAVYGPRLAESLARRVRLAPAEVAALAEGPPQTDDLRMPWPQMLVPPLRARGPQPPTAVSVFRDAFARARPDAAALLGVPGPATLPRFGHAERTPVAARLGYVQWWKLQLGLAEPEVPARPQRGAGPDAAPRR